MRPCFSPSSLPWGRWRAPTSAASHQARSEEHTSELQSLRHLVCRLLLEKKNAGPDDADEALDAEGELLKQELAERLREYARIKTLGAWLGEREAEQALLFRRVDRELPGHMSLRSRLSRCTSCSARSSD